MGVLDACKAKHHALRILCRRPALCGRRLLSLLIAAGLTCGRPCARRGRSWAAPRSRQPGCCRRWWWWCRQGRPQSALRGRPQRAQTAARRWWWGQRGGWWCWWWSPAVGSGGESRAGAGGTRVIGRASDCRQHVHAPTQQRSGPPCHPAVAASSSTGSHHNRRHLSGVGHGRRVGRAGRDGRGSGHTRAAAGVARRCLLAGGMDAGAGGGVADSSVEHTRACSAGLMRVNEMGGEGTESEHVVRGLRCREQREMP